MGLLSLIFAPAIALAKWFVGVMSGLISSAVAWIKEAWAPIGGFFSETWDKIVGVATEFYGKLTKIWEPIGAFFSSLWQGIADTFTRIVGPIIDAAKGIINTIRTVGRITLGTADESSGAVGATRPGEGPQMVSPWDRAATSMSEANSSTSVDGTITVEATQGTKATVKAKPRNISLNVQPSGAF